MKGFEDMKLENYPKLTIIMRGYSYNDAMTVIQMLTRFDHTVGVEVTTNNPNYLKIIHDATEKYGESVYIGVGTVLNVKHAESAIKNGAKFMLGPNKFTPDIFEIAKVNNVITVPAAMTPSEIVEMFNSGADIVKVFPAITLGAAFFKQVQGPYGDLKLMAVGGVGINNAEEFVRNGASYLGIGSAMFKKEDIAAKEIDNMAKSVQRFLNIFEREGK